MHIFVQNHAKGWERCGSQVGMHTCTDECTHSYQSVGPEDYQIYKGIGPPSVITSKTSKGDGIVASALIPA